MGLWGACFKKRMNAEEMQEAIGPYQAIKNPDGPTAFKAGYD